MLPEMPPSNRSLRADWTEPQLRFRPPRDGPSVSIRLRDYASLEEISVVVAALQLRWRELSARARGADGTAGRRMSAAAQSRRLHRKNPQGRKAGRSTCRAVHKVRIRDQSQNRQDVGPHDSRQIARARPDASIQNNSGLPQGPAGASEAT